MHRNRAIMTLALAGNAIALLAILGGLASLRGSTSPARSIVGSWLVVPMAPNRPPGLPNAFAFTSDGAVVRFSPTDSGATGIWTSTGRSTVTYTFVALDRNPRGEFSGTFKVRGKVKLNATYDEFAGGGKVDFFDARGSLVQSGEFTTHATRIKVESP